MISKKAVKIISDAMASLGLEYGIGEYSGNKDGKIVYPYFVGEYQEMEPMNEDGLHESTFMLTGFARGKKARLTLEDAKLQIAKYFPSLGGRTTIADDGSAVVIFYSDAFPVPKEDAELKSIQVNLSVKEWMVN